MLRNPGPGRPQSANASTDPVVIGLGRLLFWVGLLALAGSLILIFAVCGGLG